MSQEPRRATEAQGGAQAGSDPALETTAASAPGRPAAAREHALSGHGAVALVPGGSGLEATHWDAGADATLVASSASGPGDDVAGAGRAPSASGAGGDPMVGRVLHHFRILGPIGAGGMGRVYRAHDLSLDRPVALKVIAEAVSRDPEQRDRFVREARAQAKLTHPNVVSIYYIGEQDGQLFFAMELVEGEPLDAPLGRGERLPWPQALGAVIAAGEALHLAQSRGVVHRDVKPSNLLRDQSGLVKIADFGLARLGVGDGAGSGAPGSDPALANTAMDRAPVLPGTPLPGGSGGGSVRAFGSGPGARSAPASGSESGSGAGSGGGRGSGWGQGPVGSGPRDAQLTRAGAVLGSPLYMSPEQADGQPADHRSDMYSLGATLFHLVAGRPVFEAKSAAGVIGMHLGAPAPSLRRVAPEAGVPARLDRVVARLLAKRPEARYATWEDALDALREAQPQAVARAGFWVRAMAYLADYGLMSVPIVFLGWLGLLLAGAYFVAGWWLFGRTLGKWLFRLRVRTDENERVRLPRAVLRLLCQYWYLGVVLLVAAVSYSVYGTGRLNLKDPVIAEHRVLAVVLIVILSVAGLAYLLGFLWAGIRGHKAAWHDLWSRTRVVYDLPEAGVEGAPRAAASAFAAGARTTATRRTGDEPCLHPDSREGCGR